MNKLIDICTKLHTRNAFTCKLTISRGLKRNVDAMKLHSIKTKKKKRQGNLLGMI